MGFTPCKAEQQPGDMELQEKEGQKHQSIQGIWLEKTYIWKISVNSRLKATKIIGQGKEFYRQRIPESSSARKENVHINILVTSGKSDRKLMQSIRIINRSSTRKSKWNQLSKFQRTSTKLIPIEKT